MHNKGIPNLRVSLVWLCLASLAFQFTLTRDLVKAQSVTVSRSSAIVPATKAPVTLAELRSRIEEIRLVRSMS